MDAEVINDVSEIKEVGLSRSTYFCSHVYTIEKLDFLPLMSEIAENFLRVSREKNPINEIYPVIMTENLFTDSRAESFFSYVGNTAWNILNSEGYNMSNFSLVFSEGWVQEHHKHSLMESHVHGRGSQISGFYFLEAPENCSRVLIHDPRPGKVQINLPEANKIDATDASIMINFIPKPGMLMFLPSWMPHSFGRHASDKPLKFIHFNLFPELKPQAFQTCTTAEVEIV